MKSGLEQLLDVAPPRLHVIARPVEDRLPHAWPLTTAPTNAAVRRLRGKKMRTLATLFDEFAAAFQFPPYFGENWAALDECLSDLAWIGADSYLAIVWDAEELLADASSDDMRILVTLLERVAGEWSRPVAEGEAWDRPAVPFHILFVVPNDDVVRFSTILASSGIQNSIL